MKSIDLANSGPNRDLAVATIEIDSPVRADPGGHPGDAAAEDAARRDLRRAHPGRPQRAEAAGGRDACPGRRSSRRCSSTRSSGPSTRRRGPRSRPGCSSSPSRSAGRGADLIGAIANLEPFAEDANKRAARARHPAGRRPAARPQHGRGLRRAQRAPGTAPGTDPELRAPSSPRRRVRNQDLEATFRALPTFLDESRLTLEPAGELLSQRQPADHAAASVGQAAEREPEAGGEGRARLQQLLHRLQEARQALR